MNRNRDRTQQARLETSVRSAFGLKMLPFAKDRDADEAFATDNFQSALDRLDYLVDRQGTGAVFGTPGTGKSTLLRSFIASLAKTSHAVCYVPHTNCATLDLYRDIARGFQVEPRHRKSDLMADVKSRILKLTRGQKIRAVLIIDDAHLLPSSSLDELRLLTTFDEDASDDLTLILAGHPQFETSLRLAINEALAQRIVVRVHLRPLRAQEVSEYIDFRLQHAGRTARLFLPEAVEAIFRASRGIPRLVDRIAEHAMLFALKASKKEIDSDTVTEAVDEVQP